MSQMVTLLNIFEYIIILFLSLALISLTLPFISLLKEFYCRRHSHEEIHTMVKCTVIFTFIFTISSNIAYIIDNMEELLLMKMINPIGPIPFFFQCGEILSMYVFLIVKLYMTFKESVFAIKPIVIKLHCVAIITIFINMIISSVCLGLKPLSYSNNIVAVLSCFIILVIKMSAYIHLLYAFNHSLFLLVLAQTQRANINESHQKFYKLDDAQIDLLSVVRKHTILATFLIIADIKFLILFGIMYIFTFNPSYDRSFEIFVSVWFLLFLIAMNASAWVIYLGFKMNQYSYNKLCGICDRMCKRKCIEKAEKRMNIYIIESNDSETETDDAQAKELEILH